MQLRIGEFVTFKNISDVEESGHIVHLSPAILRTTQNFYVILPKNYTVDDLKYDKDVRLLPLDVLERIERHLANAFWK